MMFIIQSRNRCSQGLDPRSRTIFSPRHTDVNCVRALKATLNIIFDFWCSLSQIRPFLGSIGETVLVGAFRTPYYSCGPAGWVQASVGAVAFMRVAELAVDFGVVF